MLENQILTIGLDSTEVEKLNQVKGEFIFISVSSMTKLRPSHMKLQGLIFKCTENPEMWEDLIHAFKGKCVVAITDLEMNLTLKIFKTNFGVQDMENYLSEKFAGIRQPPEDVGAIEVGKIVKNKIFPSWGLGVVTKVIEADVYEVKFPNIPKSLKTNTMSCHKTQLRIICDIKEINHA